MTVGTLQPNVPSAADKAASASGGKTEKTAGDKPCDENGMDGRALLKEVRVGQGGGETTGRAGGNAGSEFKAWGFWGRATSPVRRYPVEMQ